MHIAAGMRTNDSISGKPVVDGEDREWYLCIDIIMSILVLSA